MRNIFVIPVMLNFETSNGIKCQNFTLTLNSRSFSETLSFKCVFDPQEKKPFKTFKLFFQLNLLVGSDLIKR